MNLTSFSTVLIAVGLCLPPTSPESSSFLVLLCYRILVSLTAIYNLGQFLISIPCNQYSCIHHIIVILLVLKSYCRKGNYFLLLLYFDSRVIYKFWLLLRLIFHSHNVARDLFNSLTIWASRTSIDLHQQSIGKEQYFRLQQSPTWVFQKLQSENMGNLFEGPTNDQFQMANPMWKYTHGKTKYINGNKTVP